MKTIGLVDYYISEWHANNYPDWVKEICEKKGLDFTIKYVWSEEYISPVDGKNTDQWCEEFGVEKCNTIEELCEKSNYILVLAPSNPEKHLEYAQKVLPYKKNTYIDKTFAQDYVTAKKIFDMANECGTAFFSSSALRYATELDEFIDNSNNVITMGGGRLLDEYIIHQIEMAQKIINQKPIAVKVEKQGIQYVIIIQFENEKRATMVFAPGLSFSACVETKRGEPVYKRIESEFFKNLLSDILRFYESSEVSFDTKQTLFIIKIREAIMKGKEDLGNWKYL